MRKLKLEIESLHVDSFEISGSAAPRGTVRGRETEGTEPIDLPTTQDGWDNTSDDWGPNPDDPSVYTCWSCGGTCYRWVCQTLTTGPHTA